MADCPSQEAGLFQGSVLTLWSSFGVPSGFFPPPPEAQPEMMLTDKNPPANHAMSFMAL